jgi:hypothetical protein
MNQFKSFCAAVLLAVSFSPLASAGPADTGALNVPANDIVGLWASVSMVGFCGAPPVMQIHNTLLFHAGGTVVENQRFAPNGVPNLFGIPGVHQRGQALGTWSYHPATKKYAMHLRFDWYVDNAYHGYMTINRDMQLSSDGMQATGPAWVTRFDVNDNPILQLCGEGVSTRL